MRMKTVLLVRWPKVRSAARPKTRGADFNGRYIDRPTPCFPCGLDAQRQDNQPLGINVMKPDIRTCSRRRHLKNAIETLFPSLAQGCFSGQASPLRRRIYIQLCARCTAAKKRQGGLIGIYGVQGRAGGVGHGGALYEHKRYELKKRHPVVRVRFLSVATAARVSGAGQTFDQVLITRRHLLH